MKRVIPAPESHTAARRFRTDRSAPCKPNLKKPAREDRIDRGGLQSTKEYERTGTEVLIETFIRKQLHLKAHTVTKVEETDECMLVYIDRLGKRLLRCGVCRQRCLEVHDIRKQREWRDLSMRKLPLKLCYRPRRVECPRCGVRVEDFPWAEPWRE